ncbi:matrix metalloproteinase-17-like protein [Cricetulus griseus]|uniref:Matrix metalloproteinase-17 n=1 Tax=Cricetulus griseus TaxID=10029 RepID=A0A061I6I3_CRIGR|nr:matrix metalloproteinase-17-like protein [Cricetulus griseus]
MPCSPTWSRAPALKEGKPSEWLSRFGYLPPADPATGQLQTQEELSKAITAMQQFGGLETTGILDEATLALMKTPRCSLPDLPPGAQVRKKRQTPPPTKWSKRNLSWRVRTFPRDSPLGRDTVRALMYYALKVWSDITPLNFHEVAGNTADIQIDFSKADHNDGYPFDGPGGTVAHAFFPGDHHTAGDTHFDDDEAWTFRSSDAHGMDLFAVAVHEFGHAIGLSHVAAPSSIMQPYYQGPVGDPLRYGLPYEDRVRVWQLYGKYFWRLTRDRHLVSLQPAQMHRFWRGLPLHLDSVDAVYERTSDHKIVFFKGDRYWVFKDNNVEEGYPRPVSDFSLPPGGIDAVFSWAHNDRTYFFKDQLYWRYDDHTRRMDPGYPVQGPLWRGVPSMLDDAMRWSDGASYFFRGQEYWKVLDGELEAAPGYPQSTARDWLVCDGYYFCQDEPIRKRKRPVTSVTAAGSQASLGPTEELQMPIDGSPLGPEDTDRPMLHCDIIILNCDIIILNCDIIILNCGFTLLHFTMKKKS